LIQGALEIGTAVFIGHGLGEDGTMGEDDDAEFLRLSFISVPVIRVKPAKSHSAMVLIESGVGLATILPQLVAI
jgi:hypothetical protein